MSSSNIRQLGAIGFLACALGMVSQQALGQEACGLSDTLFKSSFEPGELRSWSCHPRAPPPR